MIHPESIERSLLDYSFAIVSTPLELAAEISKALPNLKSGTLRFWGEWFGKPYDNIHTVVSCDATDDCLRLRFDQGEVLAVWNPIDIQIDATTLRIGSATALRWTWYYYGRARSPENLFYRDYAGQEGSVVFRTNWDQTPGTRRLDSANTFPAVEMF